LNDRFIHQLLIPVHFCHQEIRIVLVAGSVSGTSTHLSNMTWLSSLEDSIELCRPEGFKAYKFTFTFQK